jgi:hypothetical protein
MLMLGFVRFRVVWRDWRRVCDQCGGVACSRDLNE